MRHAVVWFVGFICATTAFAALTFPPLTGRVVDQAQLLSTPTNAALTHQLAAYEAQSGNQLVVATVPSLRGHEIEEYSYQLGRAWGIGQKGKNNGVLLLVAPKERRVRIEVGYGLEGALTDAQSSRIIQSVVLPRFKQGAMEQGILDGVVAIEMAVSGSAPALIQNRPAQQETEINPVVAFFMLIGVCMLAFRQQWSNAGRPPFWSRFILGGMFISRGRGRGGNDSDSGGGFSGGGGSFGGGGSSGSW